MAAGWKGAWPGVVVAVQACGVRSGVRGGEEGGGQWWAGMLSGGSRSSPGGLMPRRACTQAAFGGVCVCLCACHSMGACARMGKVRACRILSASEYIHLQRQQPVGAPHTPHAHQQCRVCAYPHSNSNAWQTVTLWTCEGHGRAHRPHPPRPPPPACSCCTHGRAHRGHTRVCASVRHCWRSSANAPHPPTI